MEIEERIEIIQTTAFPKPTSISRSDKKTYKDLYTSH